MPQLENMVKSMISRVGGIASDIKKRREFRDYLRQQPRYDKTFFGSTFWTTLGRPLTKAMLAVLPLVYACQKDGNGITEPVNTPPRIEQLTINPNGMPLPYDANIEVVYSDAEKNADSVLYGTHQDSLNSSMKVSSQSSSKIPVTIKKPVTYYVIVVDSKNAKSNMENATATGQYQPPQWQGLPAKIEVYEDMSLDSLKLLGIDLSRHVQDPLFQQNLAVRLIRQSYERLSPWKIEGNLLVPAGPLLQDSFGVNRLVIEVRNPPQLADTASLEVIVNPQADVFPNVKDITKEGEPKVATPTKLMFEKDGKRQELIVFPDSISSIQLKPGEYGVIFDNSNFWPYWLLGRQPGRDPCTYLVRNDTGGRGKLRIGVEDIVMDFHIINNNFPMVEYMGNIVGVFDYKANGRSAPWKCGFPLTVVVDTTAAIGSGRPVEKGTLDAIKKVINEYLPRVKTVEGVRVYRSITYQETNNAPRRGQPRPEGMLVLRAADDILGRAENSADVVNSNTVSGFVEFVSSTTFYNIFLKEMIEPTNNLSSAWHDRYYSRVPNTIFITGGALDFAPEDLILLKILHAFGSGTRYRLN